MANIAKTQFRLKNKKLPIKEAFLKYSDGLLDKNIFILEASSSLLQLNYLFLVYNNKYR